METLFHCSFVITEVAALKLQQYLKDSCLVAPQVIIELFVGTASIKHES